MQHHHTPGLAELYATNAQCDHALVHIVTLMIAGAAGLILSFFQEAIWSDRRRRRDALIEEERAAQPVAREELPPREVPPRRY